MKFEEIRARCLELCLSGGGGDKSGSDNISAACVSTAMPTGKSEASPPNAVKTTAAPLASKLRDPGILCACRLE